MTDDGIAEIGNARIAWWSAGPDGDGEGAPLLLVHAGVADARMWEPVLPALSEAHRVVRFDMRGFGRSRSGRGSYSPADDIAALLDALAIERAHVVGASLGGLISLELAATHPDRVASLVLLAASMDDSEPSAERMAFAEAEETAIENGRLDDAVAINVRMWAGHSTPAVQELVADMQRVAFELQLGEGADPEELDPPLAGLLSAIAVPATVAYGDRDIKDFEQTARRLHAELPDATLDEITGSGHLLALDQPEAVTQLILRHLERAG